MGTIGLGILSQFYNISGLLFAILPVGTMGLLKYFSEYSSQNKIEQINYLLRYFILLNLPLVIIICIGLLLFSDKLSLLLFSDSSYSKSIVLFSFAVPLGLFASLTDTYLKSFRNIKKYVLFSILNSVCGFVVFLPLLILYKYEGVILSISMGSLFVIIIGLAISRKMKILPNFKKLIKVDKKIIKDIVKLGVVMVILAAIQQISFLFVRTTIAVRSGMHDVGLFQSVYSISNNYFALFLGILGTYSIPLISTHKSTEETVIEINRTLRFLLLVYTPSIILCFVLRYLLLFTLYTKAFYDAGNILFFQLQGDFMKALSWVFGLWLIPYLKIKYLLVFEIINNLVFVSVFYYLLTFKNFGLQSVSIAYLTAFIGHLFLNFIFLKKGIYFRFSNKNLFLLITSILFILCIFCVSIYNVTWGYYTALPIITLWGFINFGRRDFDNLKQLIISVKNSKVKKNF